MFVGEIAAFIAVKDREVVAEKNVSTVLGKFHVHTLWSYK
jgi:hypothetical protein